MTPANDPVEDVTGPRVAVVTGASSGIGAAAAAHLAGLGWTVALVGRDERRLAKATDRAAAAATRGDRGGSARGFRCDFGVLSDVRALAASVRAAYPKLHLLANNAGGAFGEQRSTVDGFDQTIQVNHLAPFLLSHELRETVRDGRIVNTSSGVHTMGRLNPDDLVGKTQRFRSLAVYGSAKQANILFAAEAARRWPDILSTSYHPGTVRTRFGNESPLITFFYRTAPFIRTPEKGAETLIWLATTDRNAITPGGYYMDRRERRPTSAASDPELAARLWESSLDAVGLRRHP
jgi:NAD(P)-dependent dehydrogenase (short-subunit alcohol dehydrogenase family)